MSSRRFWVMEAQIVRIQAANDIRHAQVLRGANANEEGFESLMKHLSVQMGEIYRIKHEIFVAPDKNAGDKLKALMK